MDIDEIDNGNMDNDNDGDEDWAAIMNDESEMAKIKHYRITKKQFDKVLDMEYEYKFDVELQQMSFSKSMDCDRPLSPEILKQLIEGVMIETVGFTKDLEGFAAQVTLLYTDSKWFLWGFAFLDPQDAVCNRDPRSFFRITPTGERIHNKPLSYSATVKITGHKLLMQSMYAYPDINDVENCVLYQLTDGPTVPEIWFHGCPFGTCTSTAMKSLADLQLRAAHALGFIYRNTKIRSWHYEEDGVTKIYNATHQKMGFIDQHSVIMQNFVRADNIRLIALTAYGLSDGFKFTKDGWKLKQTRKGRETLAEYEGSPVYTLALIYCLAGNGAILDKDSYRTIKFWNGIFDSYPQYFMPRFPVPYWDENGPEPRMDDEEKAKLLSVKPFCPHQHAKKMMAAPNLKSSTDFPMASTRRLTKSELKKKLVEPPRNQFDPVQFDDSKTDEDIEDEDIEDEDDETGNDTGDDEDIEGDETGNLDDDETGNLDDEDIEDDEDIDPDDITAEEEREMDEEMAKNLAELEKTKASIQKVELELAEKKKRNEEARKAKQAALEIRKQKKAESDRIREEMVQKNLEMQKLLQKLKKM
ncbi:unnamed protein product, partial [Mesorhabditis spiculigera]